MTELLAPVGVHLALLLPYLVISMASPDSIRESKVLVQGLAAAIALAGLAFDSLPDGRRPERLDVPRFLLATSLGSAAFVAASCVRGLFSWTDPLVLVPVGAAAALFAIGVSRQGKDIAGPAFAVLGFAGAFTGILALLQRKAGLFVLPIDAEGARYRAAALIGSPGDVGAALVLPSIVLAAGLMDASRSRTSRALHLAGLGAVLLGIASTEALTPLIAIAAGIVALSAFDLRRRLPILAALAGAGLLAMVAVGATARLGEVAALIRHDSVSKVVTERDIGFLASLEMVRSRPVLGEGPGNFSNAFIPARIRAEERVRRRLFHSSGSAHFENAHNEWLTFAAECGLPAACLATVAAAALLFHLARRRSDTLFCLVLSLAVLGLASFPSRLAVVAGPAAFILGLAFHAIATPAPAGPGTGRFGKSIGLAAAALLLAALAAARGLAVVRQGEGEAALRAAAASPSERPYLLDRARRALVTSVAFRGRCATAWLALGSTYRLDRNLQAARRAFQTSLSLEERAETDLNLGRLEFESGNREVAMDLFRRAVWILPWLGSALPSGVDREALVAETKAIEAALPGGASPPPLRSLLP